MTNKLLAKEVNIVPPAQRRRCRREAWCALAKNDGHRGVPVRPEVRDPLTARTTPPRREKLNGGDRTVILSFLAVSADRIIRVGSNLCGKSRRTSMCAPTPPQPRRR